MFLPTRTRCSAGIPSSSDEVGWDGPSTRRTSRGDNAGEGGGGGGGGREEEEEEAPEALMLRYVQRGKGRQTWTLTGGHFETMS